MAQALTSSATAIGTFVVDPNIAITAKFLQRVAQINHVFDPATLPVVPKLAAHQQTYAFVFAQQGKALATSLNDAKENHIRQAGHLLIQLQAKQGKIYY